MESEKKIIDYRLIVWSKVRDYLDDGWQPWGSPLLVDSSVMQAMVKYSKATLRHISAMSDYDHLFAGYMEESMVTPV